MDDGNAAIRIVVKPYGSALPLGFFSFGVGMLVGGARESIEGDLHAQLERLQGEAGVRHQL